MTSIDHAATRRAACNAREADTYAARDYALATLDAATATVVGLPPNLPAPRATVKLSFDDVSEAQAHALMDAFPGDWSACPTGLVRYTDAPDAPIAWVHIHLADPSSTSETAAQRILRTHSSDGAA